MGARGAGRRVSGSKCINNDRAGSWAERSKGRVRVGVLEGGGGPDCSTYFHIAYDGALFLQSKESGDTQSGLHLDMSLAWWHVTCTDDRTPILHDIAPRPRSCKVPRMRSCNLRCVSTAAVEMMHSILGWVVVAVAIGSVHVSSET